MDQSTNTAQRVDASRDGAKRAQSHSGVPAMTDGPAGNAIYDPAEQTTREDMPRDEQPSEGDAHRGSLPPHRRRASDVARVGQAPKDQEARERSTGA